MGCGVGVLGLTLKKLYPASVLTLSDRDALALAFTRLNAGLNRLNPVQTGGYLGFSGLPQKSFDLIVANLPAKAGPPVLRHFFSTFSTCLRPGGLFIPVIVNTLEELASDALREIVFKERGPEHTVFCCRPQNPADPEELAPYIRGNLALQSCGRSLDLKTVYGLPGFDTLSYETGAMLELVKRFPPSGRTLVWNPGQGAVPAVLAAGSCVLTLGSRDLLQLEVSARNLSPHQAERRHLPSPAWLKESFENLVVFPDPEPDAAELLASCCSRLLSPLGRLYLAADSTRTGRFLRALRPQGAQRGLRLINSKKIRGIRTVLACRDERD